MGGLFSKSEEQLRAEQQAREYQAARLRIERQQEIERHRQYQEALERQRIEQQLQRLKQQQLENERQLKIKAAQEELRRLNLPVPVTSLHLAKVPFTFVAVHGLEYREVATKFRRTGKAIMQLQGIERIENPFLRLLYEQKRKQGRYDEMELFHGTPAHNVDSICEENFDYRECGNGVGVRYGDGVSFTPFSFYASHYCDKGEDKVMFLCKVLVGNEQEGYKGMTAPERGYDTSFKRNKRDPMKKDVYVKFDDDTFYPEYKITFTMIDNNCDDYLPY